jgi:hypothetical protein
MLEKSLKAAHDRGQTLMFRIMPYGDGPDNDGPGWSRKLVGDEPDRKLPGRIRTNPEDSRDLKHFSAANGREWPRMKKVGVGAL